MGSGTEELWGGLWHGSLGLCVASALVVLAGTSGMAWCVWWLSGLRSWLTEAWEAWEAVRLSAEPTALALPAVLVIEAAGRVGADRKEVRDALEKARRELALHKDPLSYNRFDWRDEKNKVQTRDPVDLLVFYSKETLGGCGILKDCWVAETQADAYETVVAAPSHRIFPKDAQGPAAPGQHKPGLHKDHGTKLPHPTKDKDGPTQPDQSRLGHSNFQSVVSRGGGRRDGVTQEEASIAQPLAKAGPPKGGPGGSKDAAKGGPTGKAAAGGADQGPPSDAPTTAKEVTSRPSSPLKSAIPDGAPGASLKSAVSAAAVGTSFKSTIPEGAQSPPLKSTVPEGAQSPPLKSTIPDA